MNGEMHQICRIVAAAKNALLQNTEPVFTPAKYEDKIEFLFMPKRKLFAAKAEKVSGIAAWYDRCVRNDLYDVKLLTPVAAEERGVLGFSNTTGSMMVCFFKSGITYFKVNWSFNAKKAWEILYTEHEWKNAPADKPRFEDETEQFLAALIKIKALAEELGCSYFAETFDHAINILTGGEYNNAALMPLPDIPDTRLRIFNAASVADVFGAMGSWNDDPSYIAQKKGLGKKYNNLSDELLKQIRLAILYSINEW